MTTNNSNRKNGTVKVFKATGATPEQLSAAASAPEALSAGILAELLTLPPLEAVATPARAAASNASAAQALPIAWPEEIKVAAAALNVELPEREPARKKGEPGQLLTVPSPKTCPWFGQVRELASIARRDDSAVWTLCLAHGWGNALPAMAKGEPISLSMLMAAVAAAPPALRQSAAFGRLWAGSGCRTSIMGVLAHQAGLSVRLDLATFALTLIFPPAPTAPAAPAATV